MKYYKTTIIGSGNLAWHLAMNLENAGHEVNEIYSRNITHAEALASRLYDTGATDSMDFSESISDIFFVAITDDAIAQVTSKMIFPPKAIVAHTSGNKNLDTLNGITHNPIGVFYPLQTFSKNKKIEFGAIPICVEASDEKTTKILANVARSLSDEVYLLSSAQRQILHVAAVFACNFSNHLMTLAKNIVENEDMDFGLLKPLITETVNKALTLGPENVQTGPAKRNDIQTLHEHLAYLKVNPELTEIYKLLTNSIIQNA